jgi:hypothetical protein
MYRDMGMTYWLETTEAEMREVTVSGTGLARDAAYRRHDRRRVLLTSLVRALVAPHATEAQWARQLDHGRRWA